MKPIGDAATVLDDPVEFSLQSAHQNLVLRQGRVCRLPADVSPFMSIPGTPTPQDWKDIAQLAGGDPIVLCGPPEELPATWPVLRRLTVLQMTAQDVHAVRSADQGAQFETVELGADDSAEMMRLAALTAPGPFEKRTHTLGRYIGIRDNGALIAMAGERMKPPGWAEISAVCTDPAYRGRGLARYLVADLIASIRAQGEQPFLHVLDSNVNAIRLYKDMGFTIRRSLDIVSLQATP